jgi:hypothetical protein
LTYKYYCKQAAHEDELPVEEEEGEEEYVCMYTYILYRENGLNTVYVSDGHGLAYKYYLLQDEDGLEVDEDEEGYVCMYVCIDVLMYTIQTQSRLYM